jgi:phosphoadenosine phosphosulfate reductase
MFFLDTGRMHEESYSFLHATISSHQTKIEVYCPEASAIENLINENGPNGFYKSVDARKKCCEVRKVFPLQRALKNADCWVTGQRREQSVTRASLLEEELDTAHGIMKFNPLASWTKTEIWHCLNQFKIKTHPLHQKNMPSIGCQPCTRPITQGEDERAGRWWWENPEVKECGLHQS